MVTQWCVALREETLQQQVVRVELALRERPVTDFCYGAAASIAFTIRLSETGYAVPSACAK